MAATDRQPDQGMTYEQFCARYGLSRRSAQRRVARGEIPVVRDGRIVRILKSDAEAWARAHRTGS